MLEAGQTRTYHLNSTRCNLPSTAAAYLINATVVPAARLGYLTFWPVGSEQPLVSALNALDDAVVSNAVIVQVGENSGVAIYATDQTHLIIDASGFFAQ